VSFALSRFGPIRQADGVSVRLVAALEELRGVIAAVVFPLSLAGAADADRVARAVSGQLDDYLLPRLGRLDAPLLVVVGGSTGAGKSTLVNSLVGTPVSPAGVLRPTTRAPVLVCHPDDAAWFTGANLLPGLGRTRSAEATEGLRVESLPSFEPGLALLDPPDIDSVVEANRILADQLLAAADLWLFVTTAGRYADAVPWSVLRTARDRGTAVALVLDRVPGSAAEEIAPHLTEMLVEHGLGGVPLFVLPETTVDGQGLLPPTVIAPVGTWLRDLAQSASARAAVVRQTVEGALRALEPSVRGLATAAQAQVDSARELETTATSAYRAAEGTVEHGIRDGELLHGEVLARWQELVGTGEFMRGLQSRVSRLRDRVAAAFTGRPVAGENLKVALESGLVTLIRGAAADGAERAGRGWSAHPAGAALVSPALRVPAADLPDRAERMVRDWQRGVLELVRAEAGNKRFVARAGAYAVNALGLVVMVAVFAATSFIPTGAEVVVAGGTTIAAQKVLEAIFGDQAVRQLADQARVDLLARCRALLQEELDRYLARLRDSGVDPEAPARLRQAAAAVEAARIADPVP
jgi:hypothetical protein